MSITAEKIGEALAYLESEYSIKECCGHPVGGNGPEDEPACCAQPDLYLRSDKVKETILSLLQQGEPEGFIERAKVAKMIDDELFSREQVAKCFEAENPNSEASRTCRDKWSAIKTLKRHFDECFSASPLPPAPGAETGK